uniref:hypothetical protein n=1 Tax=Ndongobacter massiliensis TaxID=1871025 RepID=UPI000931EA2A|nr:hypothetical protein [Ndongobacter massiliensis]
MTILSYVDDVIKFLSANCTLFSPIVVGHLRAERRSIALRIMPSNGREHYAGERERPISFQILTKSPDQQEALQALEEICEALLNRDIRVYSEPSYLQEDEQSYIYTAAFEGRLF